MERLTKIDVAKGVGQIMQEKIGKLSIQQKTNMANKPALLGEIAVESFVEFTGQALKANKTIMLKGFANIGLVKRAARNGINPATHEPIAIPERVAPVARFASIFKNELNAK